jgi:hypothetical protein
MTEKNDEFIWHLCTHTIPATMDLLPGRMDSPQARAMLLAIGLQESGFVARQQGGTKKTPGEGPAKSWWQFERRGGVQELLDAVDTAPVLTPICSLLGYPEWTANALHEAMEHNDTLACVMARLLLWRDPSLMPESNQADLGWTIYLRRWRPGRPHPRTWSAHFARAWTFVRVIS